MNADEWLAIKPGTEHIAALAIARLVAEQGGSAGSAAAVLNSPAVEASQAAQTCGITAPSPRRRIPLPPLPGRPSRLPRIDPPSSSGRPSC